MATAKKIKPASAPSVSLGSAGPQEGLERVTGVDAGMDATLALRAPPGGPDRDSVGVYGLGKHTAAADPGPPPAMPREPEGVWPFGLSRLTAVAVSRDRASLQAFDTLRFPPRVGIYKHELLEWLDATEAYEQANPR